MARPRPARRHLIQSLQCTRFPVDCECADRTSDPTIEITYFVHRVEIFLAWMHRQKRGIDGFRRDTHQRERALFRIEAVAVDSFALRLAAPIPAGRVRADVGKVLTRRCNLLLGSGYGKKTERHKQPEQKYNQPLGGFHKAGNSSTSG